MPRRLHQTLADYVVIAISPALIMLLVGSLVFFLLAVFYQGIYPARLAWVMACFVFAAVLIGRISIEEGLERAMPFGIALAIAVGIATNKFMEIGDPAGGLARYSWIINWGLIALIWWCAHRLTWDCTMIDDSEDASGEGLLQTAGIEQTDERNRAATATTAEPEGTTSRQVPAGWWQRYVEHQRRPHAPGVWVVYFSLAALPLFGFGQWFIPESDVATRRSAFGLLCVYVASGMALLVTTSFLGLRRYLRQRRIEMPTLMANVWLGIGAVIIVMLLFVAMLLPRPSAEYAISELPFTLGSPAQKSSRYAASRQEGTEDDKAGPAPSEQTDPERAEKSNKNQEQSSGESADSPAKEGPQTTSEKSEGQSKSGDGDRASNSGKKGKQSQSGDGGDKKQSDEQGNQQTDSESKSDARSKAKNRDQDGDREQRKDDDSEKGKTDEDDEPKSSGGSQQAQSPSLQPPPLIETAGGALAELMKWVFYGLFALVVCYFLWRYRAEVVVAVRDFLAGLRDLWDGLWGRRRTPGVATEEPVEIKLPPAPFESFADPFATGVAGRYSLEELVRYSFEAFEAWSREHGCTREPDQTPHELARDVARLNRSMAADARNVAELYSRAAYDRGELPATARQQLEHVWQAMRSTTAAAAMPAGSEPGEFHIRV